jgi:polyphosphate kinase 2 (PPK2 family)
MFFRTGTDFAPWYLVSSEDKRYSRVTVLQLANQLIRADL